jgi:hypothetical protein
MDMSQLQAEMMRLQTEMMQVQAKYMADPTPENMAKMQQELTAISQKMNDLSAQNTDGGGGYGQGAGEAAVPNYIEEYEKELEQFRKEHPAPADKAKYLPIGAMLLYTNDEPYEVFAMMGEKSDWKDAMNEGWGIKNANEGRKMLESLLDGRHESVFGKDYRNFKDGQPNELDDDSIESYRELIESISEYLPKLTPYAEKCRTLVAWDLDRAGYLARIFAHLEWIDSAESFEWLAKTAAKIKSAGFTAWEEYFASILIGRALHMGHSIFVIEATREIVEENEEFLKEHPISAL